MIRGGDSDDYGVFQYGKIGGKLGVLEVAQEGGGNKG